MPVTYGGPSGKRLKDDDPRVTRHRQILVSHGRDDPYANGASSNAPALPNVVSGGQSSGPVSGAAPQAKSILGGGGKGGVKSKALDPREDRELLQSQIEKYNNDGNFGYWGKSADGMFRWVNPLTDAFDGGGQDQYGTAFYGGGPLSMIGNAMKIRPLGMAREKDDEGDYIVDRADIGYRNIKDMYDRGGPQASGGRFEGAGQYSELLNLIAGERGERELYDPATDYSKIGLIAPPPLPSIYNSRGNKKPKRKIARSLLGMY